MNICQHLMMLFFVTGCAPALATYEGHRARVPLAPAGTFVRQDVADGYEFHVATLASYGDWRPDNRYGTCWYPHARSLGADKSNFQPFKSGGHWTVRNDPSPGSQAVLQWTPNEPALWKDITFHQGWWVHTPKDAPQSDNSNSQTQWCWVPNKQETAARVLWKEDNGVVAWAPEPPEWDPDVAYADAPDLDWTASLLATLLEALLEPHVLPSDGFVGRALVNAPPRRTNPAPTKVAQARDLIAVHLRKVGFVGTQSRGNQALKTLVGEPIAPVIAHKKTNEKSNGTSSTSKKKSDDSDKEKSEKSDELPQSTIIVRHLMLTPLDGPVFLVPHLAILNPTSEPARNGSTSGNTGFSSNAINNTESQSSSRSSAQHSGWSAPFPNSSSNTSMGSSRSTYSPSRATTSYAPSTRSNSTQSTYRPVSTSGSSSRSTTSQAIGTPTKTKR